MPDLHGFLYLSFFCVRKWLPDNKEKTLVLVPHDNPDEVHIFGNATLDQSTPLAQEIMGGAGTYYGDFVAMRAALKFDIGKLPKNVRIISAKLTLFSNPTPLNGNDGNPNSGSNNAILIQRITSDWQASQVKWLNQPTSTAENQVTVPHTTQSFEDLKDLNVTELVRAIASTGKNYGFFIRLQNEQAYNFRIFCSSKYSDASRHPKLEITYKK